MTPAVQDASCAAGAFLCRGSEALPVLDRRAALRCRQAAIPSSKKEYFLISTTPQALARGVTARLVQKPRRVSPPQRRKKVSIIFSGDMCGGENTARPANVRAVRQGGRRVRCSRPQTLSSKKYYFFDKENPAGSCPRGDGSACPKASRSFAAAAAKESLDHFLRRHARRRKYRSACNVRAVRPRRTARALQQAANPFVKKVLLFGKGNPAGDCLRGCLSMTLQAQRSAFLSCDAGELRLRQITPTALPSSRQTAF